MNNVSGVVEIRITRMADIEYAIQSGADRIGIGQEGCIYKAPTYKEIEQFALKVQRSGLGTVLVVPIAWPRSEQTVAGMVKAGLDAGIDEIVVNDWGTVISAESKHTLVAGLAMTRAQLATSEDVPRDPTVDGSLVPMINEFGMVGFEVDLSAEFQGELGNCQVRTVLGPEPVGWSRSCPVLRVRAEKQAPSEACRSICDSPLQLRATSRWRLIDGKREPLPAGLEAPEVTVWGNGIYRDTLKTKNHVSHYLVIDQRNCKDNIKKNVEDARRLLNEHIVYSDKKKD